ncbi:MAG: DUF402 domain-containing protein [Lachnospiraceae bacterium]|nr:DUF402 domain-containing protein [Lachnospiraceae bacterium]
MKDIRDMRRSDWHRILERRYTVKPCTFQNMKGVVSLLEIQKVTNPLTVHYEDGDVLIADAGYSWLQLAFKDQFFWATVMYDNKGELMQGYFDITGGNTFEDMENPKFQDMYLDLVLLKDGGIQVLDREELDEALEQKKITAEQYQQTVMAGEKLYCFLQENQEEFLRFCKEWREKLQQNM